MLANRQKLAGSVAILLTALVSVRSLCAKTDGGKSIDFARDVRPILADNCFHCHGPDDAERQAELRLDLWESTADVRGAAEVVTANKPDDSELIARVSSKDADVRMPPADSGKSLTPEQIETLRAWVAQGGVYQQHWAFMPPNRPDVPAVKNADWVRNPIDAFVLARLEQEGLQPSTPANATTLLRRLSLDLIGLPPTLHELEAFEKAASDSAIEREIDRLLASPHFGERWARMWLDAARYADSDGFEKDKPRFVWMYRDWVVNAFNANLPYDQFLIEQIAGDLLARESEAPAEPNSTKPYPATSRLSGSFAFPMDQDKIVATGFVRNSMINEEGGIDPEQFRMEAMFDRMDAIGKGMLGLTIGCAQCHSHKYDPLTHAEYYQMFAFLNNCHEAQITVYTPEQRAEWKATHAIIRGIEEKLKAANPDWRKRMAAWEESVRNNQPEWTIVRPQLDSSGDQKHYVQGDGSILAAGYAPTTTVTKFTVEAKLPRITAVRLELLNDPNLPHGGPGRAPNGLCALTEFDVDAAAMDKPEQKTELKFAKVTADVNPPERELERMFHDRTDRRRVTGPIEYANDDNQLTAWGVDIGPGRSNVPRKAVFVLEKPLEFAAGAELTFKLTQNHGGWNSDDNQNNNVGRFRFAVTSAENVEADPVPSDVRDILHIPADRRTPDQVACVFSYWRTTVAEWQEENRRIEALWQSHPRGTSQLALQQRESPRPTHRLDRGNFLAPAEEVTPGVPAFLHPISAPDPKAPPTRLDFARWIADRRSPTTARSIVNRVWQAYFGVGLVETAEDLGTQGSAPSHPELLDWLAVELMDHGWDLKRLHRLIVTSATYRQSSAVTPELLSRDPANRLLARGARYRVDAEVVRDIALSASGLLNRKLGGPSVYPPAPEFMFVPPASYGPKTWATDTGPDKYRRALYTFRFRSVPYPMLQTFDAPNGEFSCARRVRSNTPLQALTTLNEPLFMESARALAIEILAAGGSSDAERIAGTVRRCLAREPDDKELHVLQQFIDKQKLRFGENGRDPWPLIVDDKESKESVTAQLPEGVKAADLAAWTALARVVLNLDETISRE
jgi:hypothetical protein